MQTPADITRWIKSRCLELGFADVGIAPAEPTRYGEALSQWLKEGQHGEMSYLQQNAAILQDPSLLVPGAKSIICVADRYHNGLEDSYSSSDQRPQGRIARYAQGRDYHRVMKRRLHVLCDELVQQFPNETFRTCVDTAPLLEREYAQRAGLGSIGKNTLLINRGLGSYLFLGEVVTTLALQPTGSDKSNPCQSCTLCIEACPTDAITPWSVNATRCISYLTIEHRTMIDINYHRAIGDWIFGCDICQEVCPHNQSTQRTRIVQYHEAYSTRQSSIPLLDVLNWTEEDRQTMIAGSSMNRAKLSMIKRNALIAAGNYLFEHEDPDLYQCIVNLSNDPEESDLVRDTAGSIIHHLQSPHEY